MSFNVGDKVKCIKDDYPCNIGDIVTVKKIYNDKGYNSGLMTIKEHDYDLYCKNFELIVGYKKFKVGDIVEVINDGCCYYTYKKMANYLKAEHWTEGNYFTNGTKCKVVAFEGHEDDVNVKIYLVKSLEINEEIFIEERGLMLIAQAPQEENPKPKKNPIKQWQFGEKLVCISPDAHFLKEDIVTFLKRDSGHMFYCKETCQVLDRVKWKRYIPREESNSEEVKQKELKTKIIKNEKEKDVMTKGIVDRVKKGAENTVKNQQSIAKTAAVLEGARILNNQLIKAIKPKLPMMVRGYAETPIGKAVLANILMFGIETAMPDVSESDIRKQLAKAAVVTSYQEVIQSLDIEGMINQIFESPALKKITSKLNAEDVEEK